MNDQPDRLVDHEQRVVLLDDDERDRLGRDLDRGFELGHERKLLAALEQRPRARALALERESARVDPGLQPAARELGQQQRGRLIEPAAGQLGRDDQPALYPFHARVDRGAGNFRLYFIVQTAQVAGIIAHQAPTTDASDARSPYAPAATSRGAR